VPHLPHTEKCATTRHYVETSSDKTFASQLLSAGVDVRTVAGRLGHRNAATTLNVYAHFLEQADRGAADVIGKVIASATDRRSELRQAPTLGRKP
jgi:integrase